MPKVVTRFFYVAVSRELAVLRVIMSLAGTRLTNDCKTWTEMVICMVKISVTFRVFRVSAKISSRQKRANPASDIFSAGLERIWTLNNTRKQDQKVSILTLA